MLGLLPHPGGSAVLQLEETGQQSLAEHLGALAGKKGGKVVNADHAETGALGTSGQSDWDSGLVECGGDIVDGDRVVGVCSRKG